MQRARADASLSHVKVLRVRADVIALAPASFRVGGPFECDLYVTLIRGNSRTEEVDGLVQNHRRNFWLASLPSPETAFIRQGQRSS